MQDEPQTQAAFIIRRASPDDYPAFARLFPELLVDDPVPSQDTWSTALAPSTWIAARDSEVLGYCFFRSTPRPAMCETSSSRKPREEAVWGARSCMQLLSTFDLAAKDHGA